jgi:hypothetical protein
VHLRHRPAGTTRLVAGLSTLALLGAACTSEEATNDEPAAAEEELVAAAELSFDGPEEGTLVNAEGLADLTFAVTAAGEEHSVDRLVLLLDGDDVTAAARVDGDTLTYSPGTLPDGERTLVVADVPPSEDVDEAEGGADDAGGTAETAGGAADAADAARRGRRRGRRRRRRSRRRG